MIMMLVCALGLFTACGTTMDGDGMENPNPVTQAPDNTSPEATKAPEENKPEVKPTEKPIKDENSTGTVITIPTKDEESIQTLTFLEDLTWSFDCENDMKTEDVVVRMVAPAGATIYYTTDGTTPTEESDVYSEELKFKAHGGNFPKAYTLRAKALLADGTWTNTAARTLMIGTKLDGRYSTIVFSVSGDPDELTNAPDGIFTGENWENRGRESEREVYVEAWNPDGTQILGQFAGVRIYGGYSRRAVIKSMKLYSRKSYDADNKNFKLSNFATEKLDGSGEIIKKYDKLVLRNTGNDNQFAFIRDELSQKLVESAGLETYENVIPAVAYLNGSYYGYYWLHENYCDELLQQKFGKAEGEFIIAEGTDIEKTEDDDPEVQKFVAEYNAAYEKFSKLDLSNDANYNALDSIIDVEDYLTFFAWNIALNNWDWPNNNFKCYRYVEASADKLAAEDAKATPDRENFDGRWRYIYHDMDYTYGLYGQDKTQASYNTLKEVMNPNDERYSPLFVALMQRPESREFFRNKTFEFLNGAQSEQSIIDTYNELNAIRYDELLYYYEFMENEFRKGNRDLWTREDNLPSYEQEIFEFAAKRGAYAVKYMNELLPSLITAE